MRRLSFAEALFSGMAGMGRVWQAASTVDAILAPGLLEKAVAAGMRSVFVGFETINEANLTEQRKRQNVGRSYEAVTRRVHDALIRSRQVLRALPLPEAALNRFR
ncbi:hypothetical protein [Actinoplanes sp. NPDC026623]|uniref:hypothetical protein n=1 Tax=Actinoplanes sp. NPDC026623 TaxID=3155610 RepID=UPI0033F3D1A9